MVLYHDSDRIIQNPNPYFENPDNDFGSGFYLADDYEVSAEWACKDYNNADNIVNEYELDWSGLRVLDFLDGSHNLLQWLGTLLENRELYKLEASMIKPRNFMIDNYGYGNLKDEYDVVVGWRCDDSYFNVSQIFLANNCDIQGLRYAMSRGNMREQIVLVSPQAFSQLYFTGYQDVAYDRDNLRKRWRARQKTAKDEISSITLQHPDETVRMLMWNWDVYNNSNDPNEVARALSYIEEYHDKSSICRKY